MTKIIRTWEELVGLESDTHYLEIDLRIGNGHIRNKDINVEREFDYLSTHTFYGGNGSQYKKSTLRLRRKGFDVIIDNWDNPLSEDLNKEEYINQIEKEYAERKSRVLLESENGRLEQLLRSSLNNSRFYETEERKKLRLERESEWNRTHAQNRNELCNCGSSKKFKKCCGK